MRPCPACAPHRAAGYQPTTCEDCMGSGMVHSGVCEECGCRTGGADFCWQHAPYTVWPLKDQSFRVDRNGRQRVWLDEPPFPGEEIAAAHAEIARLRRRINMLIGVDPDAPPLLDDTPVTSYSWPYTVGVQLAPHHGYRIEGYHGSCPYHGDVPVPRYMETRAVEAADGTALEIEVCTECHKIKRIQQV